MARSQREELSGAALWTGREELLDSAVETRLRARAVEAKVDALQEGLTQLLQAANAGALQQGGQQVLFYTLAMPVLAPSACDGSFFCRRAA